MKLQSRVKHQWFPQKFNLNSGDCKNPISKLVWVFRTNQLECDNKRCRLFLATYINRLNCFSTHETSVFVRKAIVLYMRRGVLEGNNAACLWPTKTISAAATGEINKPLDDNSGEEFELRPWKSDIAASTGSSLVIDQREAAEDIKTKYEFSLWFSNGTRFLQVFAQIQANSINYFF